MGHRPGRRWVKRRAPEGGRGVLCHPSRDTPERERGSCEELPGTGALNGEAQSSSAEGAGDGVWLEMCVTVGELSSPEGKGTERNKQGPWVWPLCSHLCGLLVPNPLSGDPLFKHTVKERIPRQADSVSLPCVLHIHRARPLSSATEAHPERVKPGQRAHAWPQHRGLEGSPWGQEANHRLIHQRGRSQCPACGLSSELSVCPGGGFIGHRK